MVGGELRDHSLRSQWRFCGATIPPMTELVFAVSQEADGGFVAECLSHDIITQADSWPALRDNVREAVAAYFFDTAMPSAIRLHLQRDELLLTA